MGRLIGGLHHRQPSPHRSGIDTDAIWERVTEAGKAHGLVDIGLDPMGTRRIEAYIVYDAAARSVNLA